MKKCANIVFITCFAMFILSVLLITAFKPKAEYSYYENRKLADYAGPTLSNVLEGTYFSALENYLNDIAAGRTLLIRASTYADIYFLHRPVINEVIVGRSALYPFLDYEKADPQEILQRSEYMADQVALLRDQIEDYGGNYYYVAVPCQYVCYENEYPWYLYNRSTHTRLEIPFFTEALNERKIELIDIGVLYDSLGGWEQFCSKMDNHYNLYGAYETYRAIIERINNTTDHNVAFPGNDDISLTPLPNHYLGSYARKLYDVWNSGESLYIASFAEEIPFTRQDCGLDVEAKVNHIPDSTDIEVTYSLYMGGDIAETVINTNRLDLPSVLIYGDSFTNAVETMIYYSFDEMRSLDMRKYSQMSVSEYIKTYQPDIVICIRDYEAILSTDGNGTLFW